LKLNVVNFTNEAFSQVADSSSRVGELVAEIAAASTEQAQGIEQINTAVTEMDKVTQSNAASAEESASASEEMNAQAEQMKAMVDELVALVGDSRGGVKHAPSVKKTAKTRIQVAVPTKNAKSKALSVQKIPEFNPERDISMDDDFTYF